MSTATFLQRYKIVSKIGEGSFSEVLKCKDLRNGDYLAAKRLKKRFDTLDDVFSCVEIKAVQKISRHPNILFMFEFHYDSLLGKVTLLFELMDMSLYDFMNAKKKCVPENRAKNYLYQILCGLYHLHKSGYFHRDIKPENILIKIPLDQKYHPLKTEVVKIADLGSIKEIYAKPPYTEYVSTRWYRSPECLLTIGRYNLKMDVWATGCVFYEMLTFKPLFSGQNEVDQLAKIHNVLGTPTTRLISKFKMHKSINCHYFTKQIGTGLSPLLTNVSCDGQNLLKLMITYDPDLRANVKRLLDHKYFDSLRKPEEKIVYKRSASVDARSSKLAGDNKNHLKVQGKNPSSKFVTTFDRGSNDDVINVQKSNYPTFTRHFTKSGASSSKHGQIHSSSCKNASELHGHHSKGIPGCQKPLPFILSPKISWKTTSNLPQLPLISKPVKMNFQSKSLVIPRVTTTTKLSHPAPIRDPVEEKKKKKYPLEPQKFTVKRKKLS